jgi:hypothetical protein
VCWLQTAEHLRNYPHFLLAIMAIVGLLECFAGYRAWKFLLGLNGAVAGLFLGALASLLIHPLLAPLGAIAGISTLTVICATVEPVGTFFFTAATGVSLMVVGHQLGLCPPDIMAPLAFAAGLLSWLAVRVLGRRATIALTATAGAQQLVSLAGAYARSFEAYQAEPGPSALSNGEGLALILLIGAGLLLQLLTTRDAPAQLPASAPPPDAAPTSPVPSASPAVRRQPSAGVPSAS